MGADKKAYNKKVSVLYSKKKEKNFRSFLKITFYYFQTLQKILWPHPDSHSKGQDLCSYQAVVRYSNFSPGLVSEKG